MSRGSLRARLLGGTALGLVVALGVGGLALSAAFRRSVEAAFDARLASLQLAVIAALDVPPDRPARLARDVPNPDFDRVYSGWYWQVVDGDTRLVSRSLWDAALPDAANDAVRTVDGPRHQRLRVVSRTLRWPARAAPVTVAVAGPERAIEDEVAGFNHLLLAALAVLSATLIATLAVQVGYGLRPLRRLAFELDAIRAGRQARLGGEVPRELAPLVETMNAVLDQDARRLERARALAGNLAHGLKTPLAVLGAEAARPVPDRDRLAAEVRRLAAVVDHHLARAAAAGTQAAIAARTPVPPIVRELAALLERMHAGRGVTIALDAAPEAATFAGERQDLEEMLGNLMDNACKWAAARVVVRVERAGAALAIVVEDDGPGLPATAAGAAVQRGVRLDPDAPGSGLGLAITADLAQLYGGTLSLERATLGGLRATLRLPAAA